MMDAQYSHALIVKMNILDTLTPDDHALIEKTIAEFKKKYIESAGLSEFHMLDDEVCGFPINHLSAKQRLYLKHIGYRVICRYDSRSDRFVCTLNFT